jgi:hypothetical protein
MSNAGESWYAMRWWPNRRASRCTGGIVATASQRDQLEHLARYVSRSRVASERLSLTEGGQVRCALKTPDRDGTTHVIFEPEDFIARLATLVPKPRAHLTRNHGVFAPACPDRARVVPKTRATAAGKAVESSEPSATVRQRALTWAQRLKRVFARRRPSRAPPQSSRPAVIRAILNPRRRAPWLT